MSALYKLAQVLSGRGHTFVVVSSDAIPETVVVHGKDRPTRNSENNLIHTTIKGIANFWKWFGDSKVVDSNGKPLVVYHGTRSDFDKFDLSKASKNGLLGRGFYFTNNREFASVYGTKCLSVYVKLINPKEQVNGMFRSSNDVNDGAIATTTPGAPEGTVYYFVKSADQIKSAEVNSGNFSTRSSKITAGTH